MARRKYRMLMGMKEHPETGELLYPADVFECEDYLVEKPQTAGGWQQLVGADPLHNVPGEWQMVCAIRMPDEVKEERTLREEPSQVIGFNISEQEFEAGERRRESNEAAIHPRRLPTRESSPAATRARR